ncbi:MAG TPA: tetratricopeptide repeat protein [Burkholderiales bacterium]
MLLLAVALTAAAAPAFPQGPQTREQALAALKHADAATRAEAVVWLANRGAMSDAPLLHERLRDESPFVRAYAERGLWLLWARSGDAAIDQLMARGTEEMQSGQHAKAAATFTSVIEAKPDFAEAWNRRATVHYLAGDFERSIADCGEVLKRNPLHFGALSGMGQIFFQLQDYDQALAWYRRALEVNPNMTGVELNIKGIEELLRDKRGRST